MILTATRAADLERVAVDCVGSVQIHVADLRLAEDRRELVACLGGQLDILVNNAGLLGGRDTLWNSDLDAFEAVMDVNVTAVFDLLRQVVPWMRARNYGRIINVSSSVGIQGRATWGVYATSKFALEGLSQSLAAELEGSNVSVAVVNPGGTRTDMRREALPDEDPAGLPSPDDVVHPFLALASAPDSRYNGVRINVRDWPAGEV